MVCKGQRAVGEIEKKLPDEIRSHAVVRGSLIIDYVDDVVIFEVDSPGDRRNPGSGARK